VFVDENSERSESRAEGAAPRKLERGEHVHADRNGVAALEGAGNSSRTFQTLGSRSKTFWIKRQCDELKEDGIHVGGVRRDSDCEVIAFDVAIEIAKDGSLTFDK
jgi:hypothetical protein